MIEQVFREEWGRVLATLAGAFRDLDVAEEATQEAFAIAAARWEREGVPDNPGAWLTTTARNRAIDRLRRERTLVAKAQLLEVRESVEDEHEEVAVPDERLELVFTCCHPALAADAQVALTLRALGGLSTEEIARAFLVSSETMKRRLSRAKAKIKGAGIPFCVPPEHELPDRLAAVLAVVYLIFNQAYSVGSVDLAADALHLGGVLVELMPDEAEVHGLLALMLLHDARRDARYDGEDLVLLANQDRTRWDAEKLARGRVALDRALALRGGGPYVLQAQIAGLQVEDPIPWSRVAELHAELARVTGSPVVELNRAVAVAEAGDPAGALAIVDALDGLDGYQYWHSTRAELLRRVGRSEDARDAYRHALALAVAEPEQRYLRSQIESL